MNRDRVSFLSSNLERKERRGKRRNSSLVSILERLGRPQAQFPIVHIVGTNGKGSVGTFLSSILRLHGKTVGHFTSPHLVEFRERISIDGEIISKDEIERLLSTIFEAEKQQKEKEILSYFEVSLAAALLAFRQRKVDIVILEAGIGGKDDATNLIDGNRIATVFTRIGEDHRERLGKTLPEVAENKSAILRKGMKVISYPQIPSVEAVLRSASREIGCEFFLSPNLTDLNIETSDLDGVSFLYRKTKYHTKMRGSYQALNAVTAIEAAKALETDITQEELRLGIERVSFAGRLEILCHSPRVFVDGAQNAQAWNAVANALKEMEIEHFVVVIATMAEKEVENQIRAMSEKSVYTIFTRADDNRGRGRDDYRQVVGEEMWTQKCRWIEDPASALQVAIEKAGPHVDVLVIGSIYLAGEVHRILKNKEV